MNEYLDLINKYLIDYLDNNLYQHNEPVHEAVPVSNAIRYSVENGGKRLRPTLCLLAGELSGNKDYIQRCMPFCLALEFIHTYSLIHDDLPAMDNDDLRRGKPTVHKQFDECIAILAGDGLLNLAYEILIDNIAKNPTKANIRASKIISSCSGILSGMVKGQVLDMYQASSTKETLDNINTYKTGALIHASVLAGAVCNDLSEVEIKSLYEYSILLGKAFQIADDILDVTGTVEELGKNIGSDVKNNKMTYASLFGVEGARVVLEELEAEAIGKLSIFGSRATKLVELTKYLTLRNN